MDEDQIVRTFLAEAVLGKDAEDFFKSEIGQYVAARSNEIVQLNLQELKKVPAHDRKKVSELQYKIACAEGAITWLVDAINAGVQAMQQLENMEDQE